MKKNSLRIVLLLIVFVLIGSMGANQAKANQDSPEAGQPGEDEIYNLNYQPIDEENILDTGDSSDDIYSEEMPEVMAAGKNFLSFSAREFNIWNTIRTPLMKNVDFNCMGIKIENAADSDRYGATLPLPIPAGSKITGIGFSGLDNYPDDGYYLSYSLRRAYWDGTKPFQAIKTLDTTAAPYANPNPFWKWGSVDHVVDDDYAYYLYIELHSIIDSYAALNGQKICQVAVEYAPPSPFALAIPTVIKH